jgi:hypothetical protein
VSSTTCTATGKIAYPSKGEAVRLMGIVQRRVHGRGSLHAYRCQHCRMWHHGRNPRAVVRANRRGDRD